MKIEHVAIWTERLEELKSFYEKYFNAVSNDKYHNPKKHFSSYFLSFESGVRLELMSMEGVTACEKSHAMQVTGLAHFAFALGSELAVDQLTKTLVDDGYQWIDGPRYTGDGYYESCVLDPDGNRIELTV
ncbi:VOC family protein [Vibrio parahaemolyticus]|uniref:VOC family protein n=1 Tax=Vibrio parahaemolyticus TaxID=670 RepID=UPI001A8E91FD|nr:VOC family protein [Vibrio parahaemolyticus]MBO0169978.1 VOC family protein [Vibrio parahaemolyticus]MDF4755394.1 VOC family protein [Vibrio parahaemolyticus]MDF4781497.1 VOC family protein [Vibrio parahaemolyticus]MDF4786382.1 VOC family protein [Vibrio parahaemolyticus]MDF4825175.1 VOC family protein [Vibrio parahaemolyticus]